MNHTIQKIAAAVAVLAVLCPFAATAKPTLALEPLVTYRGDSPTLQLNLLNGDEPYAGVNARIRLPKGVSVSGASPGSIFPAGFTADAYEYDDGGTRVVSVIVYSGDGATTAGSGNLLSINLSIAANAKVGTKNLPFIAGVSGVSNADGSSSVSHNVSKGTIKIDAVPTPILKVTPGLMDVSRAKGSATFTVTNTGSGVLDWSVSFGSTAAWAKFSGATSGSGNGTFVVKYKRNNGQNRRQVSIIISSGNAGNAPIQILLRQNGFGNNKDAGDDFAGVPDDSNGAASGNGNENIVFGESTYAPFVPVLASTGAASRAVVNSPLYIRLRSDSGIDPASVWGVVEANGLQSEAVEFQPLAGSAGDGWAVYMPQSSWKAGESITMTAGATDLAGHGIGPITAEFTVESFAGLVARTVSEQNSQPDGVNLLPVKPMADGAVPPLGRGVGGVYSVGEIAYPDAQSAWLPLPDGVSAADVEVYYYQCHGDRPGWYPADRVEGWLVPGSLRYVDSDDGRYIGLDINHAGIVQLRATVVHQEASIGSLLDMQGVPDPWFVLGLASIVVVCMCRRVWQST